MSGPGWRWSGGRWWPSRRWWISLGSTERRALINGTPGGRAPLEREGESAVCSQGWSSQSGMVIRAAIMQPPPWCELIQFIVLISSSYNSCNEDVMGDIWLTCVLNSTRNTLTIDNWRIYIHRPLSTGWFECNNVYTWRMRRCAVLRLCDLQSCANKE